jgi:hypothetical protein
MIAEMKKGCLSLDYAFCSDLGKAVERCNSKNQYVYLKCDGAVFSISVQSDLLQIWGSCEVQDGPVFEGGVESPKLIALFKKLYAGSDILLKPVKEGISISEDNISVKFPLSRMVTPSRFPKFERLSGADRDWVVKSLDLCAQSLGDTLRFMGILLDNTGHVCRVIKITETAFRIFSREPLQASVSRIVVPLDLARFLKSHGSSVEQMLVSDSKVGVYLKSGLYVYMPTLYDTYPSVYQVMLGLPEDRPEYDLGGRVYKMSSSRFQEVLDLIGTVVGAEEAHILCSVEGISATTGAPVWRMSATTFTGCEASERMECLAGSQEAMTPFRINKKSAYSSLNTHDPEVFVRDLSDTFLLVMDSDARGLTFLVKAPA